MENKKKPLNISVSDYARENLHELAESNGMSISQLVRFLSVKALNNPERFGLIAPKDLPVAA